MAVFFDTQELPAFRNPAITIGTFDGVHQGHKAILQEVVRVAKEQGGASVLATFEPHPRKLLFPEQPLGILTPLQQKIALLTEAGIEHIVVVPFTKTFSELSAADYITQFLVGQLHAKSIIIGYDHHFGHDRAGNIALLQQYAATYGYRVDEIPAQLIAAAAVSSTKIRNSLQEGNVTEAAHMLGRHYSITGTVVHGAQLGRTIGFPTANIQPADPDQLIPAHGVYAVWAMHEGQRYKAMMNIGVRPTVTQEMQLRIEAHLIGYEGDLYDTTMEVAFVARLRDEQKFPSLDALKEQIQQDKEAALQVLSV
jgi:riboflavin kinase/FMN adenylyltransferase